MRSFSLLNRNVEEDDKAWSDNGFGSITNSNWRAQQEHNACGLGLNRDARRLEQDRWLARRLNKLKVASDRRDTNFRSMDDRQYVKQKYHVMPRSPFLK